MAYKSNVFSQVMQYIPKLEFQKFVDAHRSDFRTRTLDSWTWMGSLLFGQLTGHNSVRAISKAFLVEKMGLKTLGFRPVRRSTLADANENRGLDVLEDTFYYLLNKAEILAPKTKFKFKGQILAMDATLISLCLDLCPWAKYRKNKGAIKLTTAIDIAGDLPQFALITQGKVHDMKAARNLFFPPGTMLLIDRGYIDYGWFWDLTSTGVGFVTRMKDNCKYRVVKCRKTNRTQGIICDQTIVLTSQKGKEYGGKLRKISYRDEETGIRYVFLTNRFDLSAKTIAKLYKARWQVELFFKTLKGYLRIKKFLGTSFNSVKVQIWVALIAYLLVTIIRNRAKLGWSIPEVMAVIGVMMFVRTDLYEVLANGPVKRIEPISYEQLKLW